MNTQQKYEVLQKKYRTLVLTNALGDSAKANTKVEELLVLDDDEFDEHVAIVFKLPPRATNLPCPMAGDDSVRTQADIVEYFASGIEEEEV